MTSIYFKDKEMAKNETKVNEIIELNDSPIKSHNNNDMEVIEVEETPEIKMKRFSRMSSTLSPNDDSFDSPLNLPKKLNKRIFFDDEEEEDNGRNHKRQALHQYETNDEIGRIAFENMCESAIKELMDLFPEIDVCEIQDALLETNWSVFNASIKLGNLCNKNEEEVTIVSNNNLSNNSNKSKSNAINANNSNERMKSLDYYRKNVSKNFQNNKSNSSIASTSNCFIKSIKNNKNQFNKRFKEKDYENDNEKALSSDGEGSDEEYDKEDIVCISSNDDSEDDSKSYKVNKSSKTQLRVSDLRSKVVTFLQEANSFELQTIPGVSGKKIDLIINLRPFIDWNDCVFKFDNHTNLSTDILNNCCATLKARETVERLMNSCEEISRELTQTVDKLSALKQPNILNKQMKLSNYQLIGLNWLALMHKKGLNCILADEMGLGKTIQVIAFFAYLRETLNITGPHLVIVPSSTLDNWSREIQTWCPSINILLYYGSQDERTELREQIFANELKFDVIITSYNMAYSPSDKILFKRKSFKYVVFDEAHFLKNMKTSRFAGLMKIKAKHRLLLTGTPLQNNLVELMSLLIFTMPHMFYGKTDDVKALFTYSNKDSSERNSFINDRIQQAKKIMKPFVLRRLKSEVLQELPLKIDQKCICPMSANQELKYMELIENYTREIQYRKITFEDDEPEEKCQRGAGMLMNLRKAANHPLLLRQVYDDNKLRKMAALMLKEPTHKDANPNLIFEDMQVMHDFELHSLCKKYKSLSSYKLDVDLILDSGKFQELDSLLTKYRAEGKRVLLFSQFTMMLDIIEEYMNLRLYKYLRLDGQTKVGDRLELIDKFNEDSSIFVFLLSTRAGGLGINLTAASVVIIHDIDFNPYNDKQAEDRCHRIGQTKEVIVYRLISQNTVEEGMLRIAEEKLKLGRDISSPNKAQDEKEEQMEKVDVKTLLRAALKL